MLFQIYAHAQVVQVPENCVNRKSPCLLRTEDSYFEFSQRNLKIKMNPETILKLEFDDSNDRIEILEGRLILDSNKSGGNVFIHAQPFQNGLYMVSRTASRLQALHLDNFNFEIYDLKKEATEIIRSDFIDKVELISFTKNYFSDFEKYRRFLGSIESKWKLEFEKNNNSQTKVLLRSIASEQEKAKREAEQKRKDSKSLKKVRDDFFYRTFYR